MAERAKKQYASKHMIGRARKLRQKSSLPERVLWSMLRARRMGGIKFRRQHPIGPFVVDYFCEAAKVVIELDGESHVGQGEQDEKRTMFLQSRGLRVLRVTIDDLNQHRDAVADAIARAVGVAT